MVAVRVKAVERRAGAYLSFWLYLMRQIRYSVEYIWQNLPNRRSVTATHHPSLWSEETEARLELSQQTQTIEGHVWRQSGVIYL